MTNWNQCSAVERTPGRVSGAWVFSGTRIPLSALYENLAAGATIDEFVEWFPGVEKRQVRAVLEHEAQTLRSALAVEAPVRSAHARASTERPSGTLRGPVRGEAIVREEHPRVARYGGARRVRRSRDDRPEHAPPTESGPMASRARRTAVHGLVPSSPSHERNRQGHRGGTSWPRRQSAGPASQLT